MIKRRTFLATGVATASAALVSARAQPAGQTLRIGVLNDMSGIYADSQGPGSVVAAHLAAEDAGGRVAGMPIEILAADHQNKPDVGLAIARKWMDEDGVAAIVDVPNSSIALAVADLVRQRNKVFIGSGAGLADLTGTRCSPNTVHWTYDTWEISHTLGRAITGRGGKTWFTIAADYAFGADLDKNLTEAVKAAGGKVLGGVKAPFPTSDFSNFLLQAQSSGAQVLALNNAGGDMNTSLKQAAEFGLNQSMQICGPVYNINTAFSVGLPVAKGVMSVSPFYWDLSDATRAWSKRYAVSSPNHAMPNDMQAGVYAGILHLVKAVAQAGSAQDGAKVVAAMKAIPTHDPLFGDGTIRSDGRKMHPIYLLQTKTPAESHGPWDLFTMVDMVPAEQAFRPLSEGHCSMVTG
jgi:branched-chain amino acid transport system substrate-binding protein